MAENSEDTCTSTPQQKRKALAEGCHYEEGDVEFTVVDLGRCGGESCQVRSGGSAGEGEALCCQAKTYQVMLIECDTGINYNQTKVLR